MPYTSRRRVDRRPGKNKNGESRINDNAPYFSMNMQTGERHPCKDRGHAIAFSIHVNKREGFRNWQPCMITKTGFVML